MSWTLFVRVRGCNSSCPRSTLWKRAGRPITSTSLYKAIASSISRIKTAMSTWHRSSWLKAAILARLDSFTNVRALPTSSQRATSPSLLLTTKNSINYFFWCSIYRNCCSVKFICTRMRGRLSCTTCWKIRKCSRMWLWSNSMIFIMELLEGSTSGTILFCARATPPTKSSSLKAVCSKCAPSSTAMTSQCCGCRRALSLIRGTSSSKWSKCTSQLSHSYHPTSSRSPTSSMTFCESCIQKCREDSKPSGKNSNFN